MTNLDVLNRFVRLYEELFSHDGYGEIRVEMKILRKGQKEIILHCGKQHRFVVDYADRQPLRWGIWRVVEEGMRNAAREAHAHENDPGGHRPPGGEPPRGGTAAMTADTESSAP